VLLLGVARASDLGDRLATDDPRALDAAVTAISQAHGDVADETYAAGRACEDKLLDPARALGLYDRVLREWPDASVARAAESRAAHLRSQIGSGHAREATELAKLIAEADRLTVGEVIRRGDALAHTAWPGAPEATLWLAEWLRHAKSSAELADADARYAFVIATWPSSPESKLAATGRAGAAIDAKAWAHADELIAALPATTPEDLAVRDDLVRALARGRFRAELYIAAWIALAATLVLLLGSLLEAILRGGRRWPRVRPPIEIWFLGPVALVLAGASFTANQAIAPAVLRIAITGIVLAWISGATLDLLRTRGRAMRLRSLGHIALCALGVIAVAYIALAGSGLLDMLAETVHFGPE
jgi:tetratricopeptide (TPR) repeat protein